MIDLHCHSHFSDGHDSIEQLYKFALQQGVSQLALTDHDTVEGVEALQRLCLNSPIECITGVELSTMWKKHNIHILGLNIKLDHPKLLETLQFQTEKRLARAEAIAQRLESLGVRQCWEKTQLQAGQGQIGRPHFAQVLVDEGWCKNFQKAFSQYLGRGKTAYVETEWISVAEAVSTIMAAGGVAVLAHPLKYKLTRSKLCELINHFTNSGGQAVEVVSGDMIQNEIQDIMNLCEQYHLYASSGSDYHGNPFARIKLGGQLPLPTHCKPVWNLWDVDRGK